MKSLPVLLTILLTLSLITLTFAALNHQPSFNSNANDQSGNSNHR